MDDFFLIYSQSQDEQFDSSYHIPINMHLRLKKKNYKILSNKNFEDNNESEISIYSDKSYTFISNSRIINTRQISEQHNIKYLNDSKLICDLFKVYKEGFINLIEGPFSIIIIDNNNKNLSAYSDNFSSKPIYFTKK